MYEGERREKEGGSEGIRERKGEWGEGEKRRVGEERKRGSEG